MADKEVIFVVEDEFLVREAIVRELEDAGFGVMTAECGDEALDILSKLPRIDVLFTHQNARPHKRLDAGRYGETSESEAADNLHERVLP